MSMKPLEGTKHKKSMILVMDSNDKVEKTIVVLGVERGGTSMVAGVIRALGVDFGERAGRNHEDPKFLTDDKNQLLSNIKEYNAKKSVWGFKVPKASLLIDFYDKHLRNPHYVLVFRNVEATVDSWCSRGANDPMEAALHAVKYYNTVLEYLKGKRRPLVFVNYERACDNPEDFVKGLADFIGVGQDAGSIKKATSIITGDGGGYLDLPEYYFHIDALACDAWPKDILEHRFAEGSKKLFPVSRKKTGDMIIISPKGEFFPKKFYVGFDLTTEDSVFLREQGLRVYMDFTGKLFPGHAFRPPIKNGRNLIMVSTNGNVRRIALGPLRPGYVFGFEYVSCFVANEEDKLDALPIVDKYHIGESLIVLIVKKMRSMLSW